MLFYVVSLFSRLKKKSNLNFFRFFSILKRLHFSFSSVPVQPVTVLDTLAQATVAMVSMLLSILNIPFRPFQFQAPEQSVDRLLSISILVRCHWLFDLILTQLESMPSRNILATLVKFKNKTLSMSQIYWFKTSVNQSSKRSEKLSRPSDNTLKKLDPFKNKSKPLSLVAKMVAFWVVVVVLAANMVKPNTQPKPSSIIEMIRFLCDPKMSNKNTIAKRTLFERSKRESQLAGV